MTEPAPVIDVFLANDRGAWRLYVAGTSWCPPMIRDRLDADREAWLAKAPDLDALERHMWECDAPYDKRITALGGVEVRARGRSAVVFAAWLEGLLRDY